MDVRNASIFSLSSECVAPACQVRYSLADALGTALGVHSRKRLHESDLTMYQLRLAVQAYLACPNDGFGADGDRKNYE